VLSEIIAFEEQGNIIDRAYSDIVMMILKTLRAMCENDYQIADGKFKFLDDLSNNNPENNSLNNASIDKDKDKDKDNDVTQR